MQNQAVVSSAVMIPAGVSRKINQRILRSMLDVVVLQVLEAGPMHGYGIISQIRSVFHVYFGPSTVYPLLGMLQEKGYVKSEWNMTHERPRKVYNITPAGLNLLHLMEASVVLINKKLAIEA